MAQTVYYTYKETPINGNIMMNIQVFDIIVKQVVKEDTDVQLDVSKGFSMSGSKNVVCCRIKDNEVYVTLNLKIKYGTNINRKTSDLQAKVANAIQEMTNVKVKNVDINVDSIIF